MKRYRWQITVGLCLVLASTFLYLIQVAFFHKPGDTLFYLLQDFAFVPIQVLVVTGIIEAVIRRREQTILHQKLNMVVGSFFSEAGIDLLKRLSEFDANAKRMGRAVAVRADWSDRDFAVAKRYLQGHEYALDSRSPEMAELKRYLVDKRGFLLGLLENPNLLEHEAFTDLLWAVCHLTDELWYRKDFSKLPRADCAHLANDMQRAYALLVVEWLSYTRHLRDDYPYIYSLIVRTNPFDGEAAVEIPDESEVDSRESPVAR